MVFEPLINNLTWVFIIIIPLALLLVFFKSNSNTKPPRNKPSNPPQETRVVHLRGGAGEPDNRLPSPSSSMRRRRQTDSTFHSSATPAHTSTSQACNPASAPPNQNQTHPIPLSRRRLAIDMHIDLLKAQRHINTTLKRGIAASRAHAKQKQQLNARSLAYPDLATEGERQDPQGGAFPQPSTCTHQQQDTFHKENSPSRIPYQPPSPHSRLSDYPAACRGRLTDSEHHSSISPIIPPPAPSPPPRLRRRHHEQQSGIATHIDTLMRQQRNQQTNWVHVDMPFERSAGVHGSESASGLLGEFDGTDGGDEKKVDNNHTTTSNPTSHLSHPSHPPDSNSEPEPNSPSDSSWTEAHFTSSIELLEREIFYPTVPSTPRLIPVLSSSYLAAKAKLAPRQEDEGIQAYAHRYDAERELLTYGFELEPSPTCTVMPGFTSRGPSLEKSPAAADEEKKEKEEYEEIQAYARRYDAEREYFMSDLNRSKGLDE